MGAIGRTSGVGRWPIFSLSLAALIAGTGLAGFAQAAPSTPSGGHVADGAATIASSGGALTVGQTSKDAVIDWSSFDVGQGGKVAFDNGSGATLNEVTGGSQANIDGLVSGTGSVYVIDPAGIIIGKSGVIAVGGAFTAATLDPGADQFLRGGPLTFSGQSHAAVVNLGRIGSLGGDVALIAAAVTNYGQITAPRGDVGLAAGYEVVVQDRLLDNGRFRVVLGGAGTSVTNAGLIKSAEAELRANGGNVYALAGNTGSVIEATGIASTDGNVFLTAGGGETDARGEIVAKASSGAGGEVETSGERVDFDGLKVTAANWIVDPVNLTITSAAAATISSDLATTSVTLQTTASSASGPGTQSSGAGDISINSAISWSSAGTLTLEAYHGITIHAPITVAGAGGVVLDTNAGGKGGVLSFGLGSSGFAGDISYTGKPATGQSLTIDGATYTLIYFATGLEKIANHLDGDYALARPISASSVANFSPIGGNGEAAFTGVFEGLGNNISNLTIDDTTITAVMTADGGQTQGQVGLFGALGPGGLVRDVNLADVNVTGAGAMQVGAVVGNDTGGSIQNVSTSGTVTTGSWTSDYFAAAGGVAGAVIVGGQVSGSGSSAAVSGGDTSFDGGLLGSLSGGSSVTHSSATGGVTAGGFASGGPFGSFAGGLVGIVYGYRQQGGTDPDPSTVSDSYATGPVSGGGGDYLGGFVGLIENSHVNNSYATGAVTETGVANGEDNEAGGFVGTIAAGASSLSDDYATGSVTQTAGAASGLGDMVGGFAGYVNDAVISQSYSSGAVSTVGASNTTYTLAGGFAGDVDAAANVSNSYSLSPVVLASGGGDVGGFVGYLPGSVALVYATGPVTAGSGPLGGLAGYVASGGSLSDSYWDEGATELTYGYCSCSAAGAVSNITGVGGSTGISPYAAATYGYFNLTPSGPWVIFDGSTRPMLLMEYSTTITNAHQLQLMALNPAATYTLANNINLSVTSTDTDVWNPASGFVPVGGNGGAAFTGTFNGDGHTISNLFIDYTTITPQTTAEGTMTQGEVGLFGGLGPGSAVRNLSLANVDVTGDGAMLVGALAGNDTGGTILNVSTSGSVTTGSWTSGDNAEAGGLVAAVIESGQVSDSSSSASVTGGESSFDGGLLGALAGGATLTNSHATGAVAAGGSASGAPYGSFAGGLIGIIYGYGQTGGGDPDPATVTGSYATGPVSGGGGDYLGGFVGLIENSQVTYSYATGAVTATGNSSSYYNFTGGFAGGVSGGSSSLTDDYATGSVTQTTPGGHGFSDIAGGFAGYVDNATIAQSFSSGPVVTVGGPDSSTYTDVGGFAGDVDAKATVNNSYSVSPVSTTGSGYNLEGGFVGYLAGGVSDVYATGMVTGQGAVAGLVGFGPSSGSLTDSYWDEGTTGLSNGANGVTMSGVSGLTTAQLQSGLPGGFSSSLWASVAGETYPYLAWQFPKGTPQVVSGYSVQANDITGYPGAVVGIFAGGSQLDSALTGGRVYSGANGYYYYLLAPGKLPASTTSSVGMVLYASAGSPAIGLTAYVGAAGSLPDGSLQNFSAGDGQEFVLTNAGSESALHTDLVRIFGQSGLAQIASALSAEDASTDLTVTGAFSINQSIAETGSLLIGAGGALTENAGVTASANGDLTLDANGTIKLGGAVTATSSVLTLNAEGSINAAGAVLTAATLDGNVDGGATLTGANQIGALGAFTAAGAVSLKDAAALTITGPVSVAGNLTLTTESGDLTVTGPVAASTLTLDSAGEALETSAGAIDVSKLNVTAQTGIDLDSSSNSIGSVGVDKTTSGPNVIDKN